MSTTAEKIAVMQAHADGKPIEYRLIHASNWQYLPKPGWNWADCEYRVVPPPPKPKVEVYQWLYRDPEGKVRLFNMFHKNENDAKNSAALAGNTLICRADYTRIEVDEDIIKTS